MSTAFIYLFMYLIGNWLPWLYFFFWLKLSNEDDLHDYFSENLYASILEVMTVNIYRELKNLLKGSRLYDFIVWGPLIPVCHM